MRETKKSEKERDRQRLSEIELELERERERETERQKYETCVFHFMTVRSPCCGFSFFLNLDQKEKKEKIKNNLFSAKLFIF